MILATAVRFCLPFTILALLAGQSGFYHTMEIDPGSRMVRFSNEFPIRAGIPTEEYFERLDRANDSMVSHIVPLGRNQPSSYLGNFFLSRGLVVRQRTKLQEVFRGAFGVIVARSTYYYPGEYDTPEIGFDVRAESTKMKREAPRIIHELPSSATLLHSITVSRIFSSEPEALVAVGTYNPDGDLLNVSVDAFRSGSSVPRPAGGAKTMDDVVKEDIQHFGFPLKFSVDRFRQNPSTLDPRADHPHSLTVISFHYERNRWIEQYVFDTPDPAHPNYETRELEFRFTDQDATLQFVDRTLRWTTIDLRKVKLIK